MSKTYWHFAAMKDGKPVMRDGTMIEPGKRYTVPKAIICKSGFHGSELAIDSLKYAPGSWVSKRDIDEVTREDDKVCGPACVHTEGFDATEILRKFARLCALDVIDLWGAPEIVVRYLKTGDESIRVAASDAAWDAARYAARDAAWNAAWNAAWAAAWDAARYAASDAARYAASDAARDVAWNAAWNAAWAAAWAAASDAARDAAMGKQNRRLTRMLNAGLKIVEANDE